MVVGPVRHFCSRVDQVVALQLNKQRWGGNDGGYLKQIDDFKVGVKIECLGFCSDQEIALLCAFLFTHYYFYTNCF